MPPPPRTGRVQRDEPGRGAQRHPRATPPYSTAPCQACHPLAKGRTNGSGSLSRGDADLRNGNGLPANHANHAKGEPRLEHSEDHDQSLLWRGCSASATPFGFAWLAWFAGHSFSSSGSTDVNPPPRTLRVRAPYRPDEKLPDCPAGLVRIVGGKDEDTTPPVHTITRVAKRLGPR